jgi:DNA (cytosine-5)-methyltransferase 1
LIEALDAEGRAPWTAVFENVDGIKPENLCAVQDAFTCAGYRHTTRVIDAKHFVPQSRKRYFVVGAHRDLGVDPEPLFEQAMRSLPKRTIELSDVIDLDSRFREYSPTVVAHHLAMLNAAGVKAVAAARALGRPVAMPFARRTRYPNGVRTQTVEVRQGGIANALKVVSKGGSNHQFLLIVHDAETRVRPIAPNEAARLMALDSYILPNDPIAALDLCGDGVVTSVVAHLARHVIEPALARRLPAAAE